MVFLITYILLAVCVRGTKEDSDDFEALILLVGSESDGEDIRTPFSLIFSYLSYL